MAARRWNKAELARLVALAHSATAAQAAEHLGRSVPSVKARAARLGLVFCRPSDPHLWSQVDEELLSRLAPTHTVHQLAVRLGRSELAVAGKAKRLGVRYKRADQCAYPPWTENDLALLRAAAGEQSAQAVAARLGRTVPAVRRKAFAIGVRLVARGARNRKYLRAEHYELMRRTAGELTAAELAERTGVERHTIYKAARRLGIELRPAHGRPWTERELQQLRWYAGHKSAAFIARRLGRTQAAVHARCRMLGLLLWQADMSLTEAGRQLGYSPQTVRRMLVEIMGEHLRRLSANRYAIEHEQWERLVRYATEVHRQHCHDVEGLRRKWREHESADQRRVA